MRREPADHIFFQLLILLLIALLAWAVLTREPVNVVVFNLQPRPVPVIQIPQ